VGVGDDDGVGVDVWVGSWLGVGVGVAGFMVGVTRVIRGRRNAPLSPKVYNPSPNSYIWKPVYKNGPAYGIVSADCEQLVPESDRPHTFLMSLAKLCTSNEPLRYGPGV
jgi:hypothetical protein